MSKNITFELLYPYEAKNVIGTGTFLIPKFMGNMCNMNFYHLGSY